jgi:hypothetical protein
MSNCIFEPSADITSSTICKHCGQEKILHNHNIQVPQLYTEEQVIEFTMTMIAQYVVGNTNIWNRDMLKETLSLKQPKKG